MTITAYQAFNNSVTLQKNTSPTLCVQLRLPNTGTYVVFGRFVVNNLTALPLVVTANLSTLDGVTNLNVVSLLYLLWLQTFHLMQAPVSRHNQDSMYPLETRTRL